MNVFTMGFTQKNAEEFFNKIQKNKIDVLVDIRLNNKSQLAGFAKGRDLEYFLKIICNCAYKHEIIYAPTKELLDAYKKGSKTWEQYITEYNELIINRHMVDTFEQKYSNYNNVLLLCSEPTPEQCHRRLLAEAICLEKGHTLKHI